jgi:hypothetical protein
MSEIYMWKSYIAREKREKAANLEAVIGRALTQDLVDRCQSVAELSEGFASVTAKTGLLERLFGDV